MSAENFPLTAAPSPSPRQQSRPSCTCCAGPQSTWFTNCALHPCVSDDQVDAPEKPAPLNVLTEVQAVLADVLDDEVLSAERAIQVAEAQIKLRAILAGVRRTSVKSGAVPSIKIDREPMIDERTVRPGSKCEELAHE